MVEPSVVAQRYVAAASAAARRLGLLAEPATLDAVVARTGLARRRVAPLLELLVAAGHVDDDAGVLTPRALAADAPGAALIAEVVARDRAYAPARDGWSLQLDARQLAPGPLLSLGAAARVAARVVAALPPGGVFLDAGGGLGDVTRAVLTAAPTARAVLVELPACAAAAGRHLAELAARVEIVAGDLRAAALPACDVALLSNVLHLHDAADAAELVAAVARAVRPGGALLVKDVVRDVAGEGRLRACAFAVAAAIFDDRGDVHATRELAAWLGPCELEDPMDGAPECALATARVSRPSR